MALKEKDLRAAIVARCRALGPAGLTVGTAGNISARLGEAMLITPSSVAYESLRPAMIASMPLGGEYGAWAGPMKPSTEWRFHLDIMRARPDVGAIVHFHSTYCCALAMLHKPILAAHYMIALFGGPVVKCTKYAPYGTKELSELALEALGDRHAVLLGNHGAIVTGADLTSAWRRAIELENLAHMYYLTIAVGRPAILSDDEVGRIVDRFRTYGAKDEEPAKRAPKKALKKAPKKALKAKAPAKVKAKAAPRRKKAVSGKKKAVSAAAT